MLFRSYGVRDTGRIIPEAAAEKRRLMRLGGRAFDREFVRYMVEDHHKDISDFREHAAGRGAVAELARRTLPVLERHLQTAERLAGAHKPTRKKRPRIAPRAFLNSSLAGGVA